MTISQAKTLSDQPIIVGGGLVGLSLALGLARSGFKPIIIERTEEKTKTKNDYDGRASAISASSGQLFHALGIWATLRKHAQPIYDIRVADGNISGLKPAKNHRQSEAISPFTLDFLADRYFDKMPMLKNEQSMEDEACFGWIIENRHILSCLQVELKKDKNITRIYKRSVDSIEILNQQSINVTLDDQSILQSPLVLACDGKFSTLRKLANIGEKQFDYHQNAIVCTVQHEATHDGIAVELFLPAGPFAMLPMTEQRTNIVWSERRELADKFINLPEPEFMAALHRRFGDWLGEITLTGPRFSYPLGFMLAERMVDKRLALVGDSAHSIHPIAGQGFNMGLRDIAALVEILTSARARGEDFGSASVLNRYQQWRRFDNHSLSLICDGLLRLFSNEHPLLQPMRRLGLGLVNQAEGLKSLFARHAMGRTGTELPVMLKGKLPQGSYLS